MQVHPRAMFWTVLLTMGSFVGANASVFNVAPSYSAGKSPNAVVAGDFNGDGIQDLATATDANGGIYLLPGTGNGKFGSPVNYPTAHPAVLVGKGDGTFSGLQKYPIAGTPFKLLPGDLNGDGFTDLAVTGTSTIGVFLSRGN